jgi:hypothetical protein
MIKFPFLGLLASISLYGVEGTYMGSGTDPNNKLTYTVTATFTKDQNGTYQATWDEVQKGNTAHYEGTGLEQAGYLSFVYQNTDDASDTGLQFYKIKGNTLEGRFVSIHKNLVGTEKLSLSQQ